MLYVQLNAGSKVGPEEIFNFLSENISERPDLPKEIIIVEAIPTTAVGNIFKPGLRGDMAGEHFSRTLTYLEDEGLEVVVAVG